MTTAGSTGPARQRWPGGLQHAPRPCQQRRLEHRAAHHGHLGCGSWAGNIFSGNVNWLNFMNITMLSIPKEEYIPAVEDLCGNYLKKWGKD
jgi:hypothetical protein